MSIILSQPTNTPDLRTDRPNFQACLEAGLKSSPDLQNEVAIYACVKEPSSAISKALTGSARKYRPRVNEGPITGSYSRWNILKKRLRRQWQCTRDPALKAEVNRLRRSINNQLNGWKKDQWSNPLEILNPEDLPPWKLTRRAIRIPTPSPLLVTPLGLALSDFDKTAAITESLEAQFQPVNDPSVPVVIEVVNEVMRV